MYVYLYITQLNLKFVNNYFLQFNRIPWQRDTESRINTIHICAVQPYLKYNHSKFRGSVHDG